MIVFILAKCFCLVSTHNMSGHKRSMNLRCKIVNVLLCIDEERMLRWVRQWKWVIVSNVVRIGNIGEDKWKPTRFGKACQHHSAGRAGKNTPDVIHTRLLFKEERQVNGLTLITVDETPLDTSTLSTNQNSSSFSLLQPSLNTPEQEAIAR